MYRSFLTGFTLRTVILLAVPAALFAQTGNTVSGFVFGSERRPIPDANVELLDEYGRTLERTHTNASGRYTFARIGSGRFRARVFSVGEYQEQEQEFEIQNIRIMDGSGNVRTSGFENVQKDFYLQLRQNRGTQKRPDVLFVQEVPQAAQEKFRSGLHHLENNNEAQGLLEVKTAIEIFPDYYDALERLGLEYVRLKHFMAAQLLFLKAVQVYAGGFKSWHGLAYSQFSLNQVGDALQSVKKALQLDARSLDSMVLAGILFRQNKQFTESENFLKKANELSNGRVPQVHWHLAILYANDLKRYKDAVSELETFLRLSPNNPSNDSVKKLIENLKTKSKESS